MKVAETILQQLGGNKFIAMTGSKNFVSDGNTLRMRLAKNKSKANFLAITLDEGLDLYRMRFFYYRPGRIDLKTGRSIPDKMEDIDVYDGVYAEDLCRIFESVTGMYTRLF